MIQWEKWLVRMVQTCSSPAVAAESRVASRTRRRRWRAGPCGTERSLAERCAEPQSTAPETAGRETPKTLYLPEREREKLHVYFNTEHYDVMSSVCCYLHYTWQTVTHLDLNLRHWFHTQTLMGCTKCQFLHNAALKIAPSALFNVEAMNTFCYSSEANVLLLPSLHLFDRFSYFFICRLLFCIRDK